MSEKALYIVNQETDSAIQVLREALIFQHLVTKFADFMHHTFHRRHSVEHH